MRKVALVTGANRGLGLETARQLAERSGPEAGPLGSMTRGRDWSVILACRDVEKGRAAAAHIPGASVRPLDLADRSSIDALGRALATEGVTLDALVNNAAISMRGFNAEVATTTIHVNLAGTLAVTAAIAPRVADGGAIVMVSSGMGELAGLGPPARERVERAADVAEVEALAAEFVAGVAQQRHEADGWPSSAYSVSKALLNAATRVLARKLEPHRIRVNAVCPGWVRTDLGGSRAPRDVKTGAASIIATILEPRATGGFFRDGKPIVW